jgi:type VI secretion system protein VasJ
MNEPVAAVDHPVLGPIAGALAVGPDLTYEPHLEQLAAEVAKTTSLAGETTDWHTVRSEALRILREESKDLGVASWWVVATAHTDGWQAAAEALVVYLALVDRFWAEMHPSVKRPRGRVAFVSWVWENLAKALAPRPVGPAEREALVTFEAAASRLEQGLAPRLGEQNPGLGALRALLREKLRAIPEPAAAAVPQAAAVPSPTPGQGGSPPATAVPAAIAAPEAPTASNLDEAEAAATQYRASLSTLAHVARTTAPTSPWSYRLARVSAWLTIEGAPDLDGGKTFVRAPRGGDRTALAELFESGAWDALRDAAEDALSEHIFWLDLHRYTATALERLGPTYAAARAAVQRETAAFIARVPALPSRLFSNGTPFASPETVDWLAQEQARLAPAATNGRRSQTTDSSALLATCEAGIAGGQVDEALATALAAAQASGSTRSRFQSRLGVARLAHRSGKDMLASAILEGLLSEVDPTLEAWEPALCGELLEALAAVLRATSPEDGDRQQALFRRLLPLDPVAALRVGG